MRNILRILFVTCAISTLSAQAPAPSAPAFREIDGSKNPELIPLTEAMKSMFAILCDGPVPQPILGRGDYFRESQLTQDQQDVVTMAAIKYHLAVNSSVRDLKKVPRNPATFNSDRQAIMKKLDRQFEEIQTSLESDLGPEAYKRLVSFIETSVKRRISLSIPVNK